MWQWKKVFVMHITITQKWMITSHLKTYHVQKTELWPCQRQHTHLKNSDFSPTHSLVYIIKYMSTVTQKCNITTSCPTLPICKSIQLTLLTAHFSSSKQLIFCSLISLWFSVSSNFFLLLLISEHWPEVWEGSSSPSRSPAAFLLLPASRTSPYLYPHPSVALPITEERREKESRNSSPNDRERANIGHFGDC